MSTITTHSTSGAARSKLKGPGVFSYSIMLALAFYAAAPLVVLFLNSLKSTEEASTNSFGLPQSVNWSNYIDAWRIGGFSTTLLNSTILVALSVAGVLVVSFLAAYGLARYTPRGHDFFLTYLLVGSTIPVQLYLIPLFVFLTRNELMDNLFVLSVLYVAKFAPFATFLLRAFLLGISSDFEDAARVDGASEFQVLRKIVVPLLAPAIMTVGLVTGLQVWNEFTLAVTLIQSEELKPVSTSLFAFQQRHGTDWGLTNAGAVITVLPVIILFLLLQRRFIEGLTQGGSKG